MRLVVLNCNITGLFKYINPPNDLVEYVPQYNSLSALASVLPTPPDAFLSRLIGKCVQVCKDSKFVRVTEVNASPFLVVQLGRSECPEIVTRTTQNQ